MNTSLRYGLTCILFGLGMAWGTSAVAQELNCRVQVIAPQIANIEASIFESLEENIQEFMNGRRWTNDDFQFEERIECTMQITISEAPSPTSFRGNIQVHPIQHRPIPRHPLLHPGLLRVHDFGHGLRQHGVGWRNRTLPQGADHCRQCTKLRTYRVESEPRQSKPLLVSRKYAFTNFPSRAQLPLLLSPHGTGPIV